MMINSCFIKWCLLYVIAFLFFPVTGFCGFLSVELLKYKENCFIQNGVVKLKWSYQAKAGSDYGSTYEAPAFPNMRSIRGVYIAVDMRNNKEKKDENGQPALELKHNVMVSYGGNTIKKYPLEYSKDYREGSSLTIGRVDSGIEKIERTSFEKLNGMMEMDGKSDEFKGIIRKSLAGFRKFIIDQASKRSQVLSDDKRESVLKNGRFFYATVTRKGKGEEIPKIFMVTSPPPLP